MLQRKYLSDPYFIPLVTGFISLLFYFSCLSPTLTYGGDCDELIAASWMGGIPHPTGYPL